MDILFDLPSLKKTIAEARAAREKEEIYECNRCVRDIHELVLENAKKGDACTEIALDLNHEDERVRFIAAAIPKYDIIGEISRPGLRVDVGLMQDSVTAVLTITVLPD